MQHLHVAPYCLVLAGSHGTEVGNWDSSVVVVAAAAAAAALEHKTVIENSGPGSAAASHPAHVGAWKAHLPSPERVDGDAPGYSAVECPAPGSSASYPRLPSRMPVQVQVAGRKENRRVEPRGSPDRGR